MYTVTSHLQQRSISGDDSIFLVEKEETIWFCVADGAGGTGSGLFASNYITQAFSQLTDIPDFSQPDDFESFLVKIDLQLLAENTGGESTGILTGQPV